MTEAEAIKAIHGAVKQRTRADEQKRRATGALRDRCLQAQAVGVPMARIAREASLSRQGLYELLGDQRPS